MTVKQSLTSTSSWLARWSAIRSWLTATSQHIFLRRTHWLTMATFIVAALISVGIITSFLFSAPANQDTSVPTGRERLQTASIDYLELWIEERQNNYQRPLQVPAGIFSDNR